MMIGKDMAGCLPMTAIAFAGVLSGFILPSMQGRGLWGWFVASLVSGIIAVALLAYARFPLYRQGKFLSIGPKELPPKRLPAYRWAWRLIILAVCVQVFLLLKTR